MNSSLSEKIKLALANGEKVPSALKDETGATYPEIFTALSQLTEAGEVEHRFAGDGAGAVLCYRLARKIILPMFGRLV